MSKNKSLISVDNQEKLESLAAIIPQQDIIYFDMEVDNMYHYYNEVSLIQLLIGDTCYIVDAMSDIEMPPLLEALKNSSMVIHGSDFDLRTLFQHYKFVPNQLFDTMIAARLIGIEEFGLGALVQSYFDVKLDKQYQKANWSIRPLKPEMLEYAAGDTFYLPQLHNILTEQLEKKNRLHWHQEYCEHLKTQTQIVKDIDHEKVWRIKGSVKLEPRQLQGLKTIWYWRDESAKMKNWPPFKIMNTESMILLAKSIPDKKDAHLNLKKLPLKTHTSLKQSLLNRLEADLSVAPESWPDKKAHGRLRSKPKDPPLIENMKKIRDKIAADLGLTPPLLINKESLIAVAETGARDKTQMEEAVKLMKWQQELLFDAWIQIPK